MFFQLNLIHIPYPPWPCIRTYASIFAARRPGRPDFLAQKIADAGPDVMGITGDQDVRIDFTDPDNQVKVQDELYGGRNADFFFSSLSLLDPTDGDNLIVHGGSTTDDSVVGNNTPQDSDWMLIEAADDEEPVTVDLRTEEAQLIENAQFISTATGVTVYMEEIEHVDASGNLYGFLNDMSTTIGEGAGETHTAGEENCAYGATAQLDITGSLADRRQHCSKRARKRCPGYDRYDLRRRG